MVSDGLVRERIELASARVALNGGVKLLGVEGLEPGTKSRQLARRKLFDGFLDVFGGSHGGTIAVGRFAQKGRDDQRPQNSWESAPRPNWARKARGV
jgi:hypothetical protein